MQYFDNSVKFVPYIVKKIGPERPGMCFCVAKEKCARPLRLSEIIVIFSKRANKFLNKIFSVKIAQNTKVIELFSFIKMLQQNKIY